MIQQLMLTIPLQCFLNDKNIFHINVLAALHFPMETTSKYIFTASSALENREVVHEVFNVCLKLRPQYLSFHFSYYFLPELLFFSFIRVLKNHLASSSLIRLCRQLMITTNDPCFRTRVLKEAAARVKWQRFLLPLQDESV